MASWPAYYYYYMIKRIDWTSFPSSAIIWVIWERKKNWWKLVQRNSGITRNGWEDDGSNVGEVSYWVDKWWVWCRRWLIGRLTETSRLAFRRCRTRGLRGGEAIFFHSLVDTFFAWQLALEKKIKIFFYCVCECVKTESFLLTEKT